jgi:hypothetical protein
MLSKWIYSYDEKSIFPSAHQVKIIGYTLSRLEVKLHSYSSETNLIIYFKLKN